MFPLHGNIPCTDHAPERWHGELPLPRPGRKYSAISRLVSPGSTTSNMLVLYRIRALPWLAEGGSGEVICSPDGRNWFAERIDEQRQDDGGGEELGKVRTWRD